MKTPGPPPTHDQRWERIDASARASDLVGGVPLVVRIRNVLDDRDPGVRQLDQAGEVEIEQTVVADASRPEPYSVGVDHLEWSRRILDGHHERAVRPHRNPWELLLVFSVVTAAHRESMHLVATTTVLG